MPVLAARLADVLVPYALPPVLLGLEEHLLDPAAVLLLEVGPLVERPTVLPETIGKVVTKLLELDEPQEPRGCRSSAPSSQSRRVGSSSKERTRALTRAVRPARAATFEPLARRPRSSGRAAAPTVGVERRVEVLPARAISALSPDRRPWILPQKTWVPSIPIRCTSTVLSTIDLAVAVPTPTGPPRRCSRSRCRRSRSRSPSPSP